MLELYIDSKRCDLAGNETIAIDYAMFSLDDISARNGSRSYTFKLPDTVANRIAFEMAYDISNLTFLPYQKLNARLLSDGVDMGVVYAELLSFNDGYSVALYGGNSGFFINISGRKLVDLELSEYDHFFNFDNAIASFSNSQGYIYPVIDYFANSPNSYISDSYRRLRVDYLLPAIFFKTVIDKIITEAGYAVVDETAEQHPEIFDLILPGSRQLKSNFFGNKYLGTFAVSTTFTVGSSGGLAVAAVFGTVVSYNYNFWQLPLSIFAIPELSDIEYTFSFEVRNSNALLSITLSVNLGLEGVRTYVILPSTTVTHTVTISKTDADNPGLETNGGYPIGVSFWDNAGGQLEITSNTTLTISKVTIKEQIDLVYGDYVSTSGALPDMLQSELLKNYLQLTCSIITVNEVSKIVYIKPFSVLQKNISSAVNWSDKLDLSILPEISFAGDYYAQSNKMLYKQDGEEIKPIGTDGVIEIDNANLPAEKNIIELIFAGTNRVGRLSLNPDPTDLENELYINRIGLLTEQSQDGNYQTTSTDTFTVGTGSKTFTVQAGLSFKETDRVGISEYGGGTGYMEGVITAYSGTSMTIAVDCYSGSGSISGWELKLVGPLDLSDAEPRVLFLNKVDSSTFPNTTDGIEFFSAPSTVNNFPEGNQTVTTNIPLTWFIDKSHANNLGFADSLIADYYGSILDLVERYKKVTVGIRLNAVDINRLDFTKPVFIQYFNAYFYINKINGYQPGDNNSTEVELVKIF